MVVRPLTVLNPALCCRNNAPGQFLRQESAGVSTSEYVGVSTSEYVGVSTSEYVGVINGETIRLDGALRMPPR